MWDFDADDDSFFPSSLCGGSFSLFGRPPPAQETAEFSFQAPRTAAPDPTSPRDGQAALLEENARLRETASSLSEKLSESVSLNEKLKNQLEECRSTFRNAIFSGFRNHS
jgi:hypothetical protein